MVNNSTKINKTTNNLSLKKSLKMKGQQFPQNKQNKLLVELLTFTVQTFFRWEIIVCCVDIGGIVDLQCLKKFSVGYYCSFCNNNLSPKEILNSEGQQFHQYQQNKQ
jgi:hypothetical protein